MKFMNQWLLWQRFVLIGIVAFTLGGIPFYMYLAEAHKTLDFAYTERHGIAPLKLIIALHKSVQDDRGLTVQLLNGINTVMVTRAAKQTEIDAIVAAIDVIVTRDNWNTALNEHWQVIKTELALIAATVAKRTVSAMETRKQHNDAIAAIHTLRKDIAAYYKLSFDPEPASANMMPALVYDVFGLLDPLGLIRASGADVLFRVAKAQAGDAAAKMPNDAERVKLIQLISEAQTGLATFSADIKNAIMADPRWQEPLSTSLKQATEATAQLFKLTDDEIIHAQAITYNPIDYRKIASKAVDSIDSLNSTILVTLYNIIQQRVTHLEHEYVTISALMLAVAILGTLLGLLIMRSILGPIEHLVKVMQQLGGGNFNARATIDGCDEVAQLGRHFNQMVDEREALTNNIRLEYEQLNSSVILLLQAVARLSQRDLTVQIPVAQDLTGPLSDAMNMLTAEMARTLRQIADIAGEVSQASFSVREQADLVSDVVKSEREQIEKTAAELDHAALTMLRIARLAQSTNIAADKASQTTQNALTTVGATIDGIGHIRATIHDAETRLELLGISSREISGAVDLISGIARRTQILAVSASMHAASVGEAGHGFQVIANEVQRLAETVQQAAAKIGALLANIQGEVTDTITTMNNVIKQVAEGAKLAEQAGEQMRLTQNTTADLVTSVQTIAESSEEQAQASADLLNRAHNIRKSTQITSKQLKSQTAQTENLVKYANHLLNVVQIFKLPT